MKSWCTRSIMFSLFIITQTIVPMHRIYAKKAALVTGISGVFMLGAHQQRLRDAFQVIECMKGDENATQRLRALKSVLLGQQALYHRYTSSNGDSAAIESTIYLDRGNASKPFHGGIIVGRSVFHKRCWMFSLKREHYELVPVITAEYSTYKSGAICVEDELETLAVVTRNFMSDPKLIMAISQYGQFVGREIYYTRKAHVPIEYRTV